MKRPAVALVVSLIACCQAALGQEPRIARLEIAPATTLQAPVAASEHFVPPSLSAPAVTPELWIYSQELRRHDDPAQAVRRKAELKADERMGRLAAMKWYGYSNSRPVASSIPTMGQYSPAWIGNGWQRYDWANVGATIPTIYVNAR